jgi:hypothetical protein
MTELVEVALKVFIKSRSRKKFTANTAVARAAKVSLTDKRPVQRFLSEL